MDRSPPLDLFAELISLSPSLSSESRSTSEIEITRASSSELPNAPAVSTWQPTPSGIRVLGKGAAVAGFARAFMFVTGDTSDSEGRPPGFPDLPDGEEEELRGDDEDVEEFVVREEIAFSLGIATAAELSICLDGGGEIVGCSRLLASSSNE